MNKNLEQSTSYRKRLISNARAIITNQIAMPLGAVKMNKLVYWGLESVPSEI